jgi:putative colanic acid biosynthesis UDP-glucose lipid carrier transferase
VKSGGAKSGLLREYGDVTHAMQRLVDIVLIAVVHVVMTWAYHQPWRPESSNATIVAILGFSIAAELCSLYRPWRIERLHVEIRTVLVAWLWTMATMAILAFATKVSQEYSRVISFGWFLVAPLVLCGWRLTLRSVLRALRARGRNIRRAVLVGATASARELCEQIDERPWMGIRVQGFYDDRTPDSCENLDDWACPHLGNLTELVKACRAGQVDAVYIALPLRAEPRIAEVMRELADTTATVYLVADFFHYDLIGARMRSFGRVALISMHDTHFHGLSWGLKRLEDIVVGSMILALISIPMLIIALLVRITSRGNVFFRQRRYGLNGKEIRILKFRTMTVCEDGPQITQAKKNDARVTPLGRFLRRTSLDELPQFLQVIMGEMSIVGPRPHAVAHNESYRSLIPGYMLRHKVKPGITGWAQVNGWRGETPDVSWMRKRVEHDLEYIGRWTVAWDIKIILLTIFGRRKNQNAF